jgi:protein-disulfide isomerase
MAKQPVATPVVHPYSFQSFIEFINNNFAILVLIAIFFMAGIVVGSLWTEAKGGGKLGINAPAQQVADDTIDGADAGPTPEQLKKVAAVTDKDHIRGNKKAKVVLVEYTDFECPFCARFHPTMKQVMEEYGDKVAWVQRNYPLSFHPQALPAAQAAECVAKSAGEDAYWKYSDKIFEINTTNQAITAADIQTAVTASGANWTTVKACVDSGEFTELINGQMANGTEAGVSGTPGTIVITQDGEYELINGALPFASVKTVLDKYVD